MLTNIFILFEISENSKILKTIIIKFFVFVFTCVIKQVFFSIYNKVFNIYVRFIAHSIERRKKTIIYSNTITTIRKINKLNREREKN